MVIPRKVLIISLDSEERRAISIYLRREGFNPDSAVEILEAEGIARGVQIAEEEVTLGAVVSSITEDPCCDPAMDLMLMFRQHQLDRIKNMPIVVFHHNPHARSKFQAYPATRFVLAYDILSAGFIPGALKFLLRVQQT